MSPRKYAFRAETVLDAVEFFARIDVDGYVVARVRLPGARTYLPDVVVRFQTAVPLETLRRAAADVPDGHVLAETLEPADAYTGNRTPRG